MHRSAQHTMAHVRRLFASAAIFYYIHKVPKGQAVANADGLDFWQAVRQMHPVLLPLVGAVLARSVRLAH